MIFSIFNTCYSFPYLKNKTGEIKNIIKFKIFNKNNSLTLRKINFSQMAEVMRFELMIPFGILVFETSVLNHSTTLPDLSHKKRLPS